MGERLEQIAFAFFLVLDLVLIILGVVLFVVTCRELLFPMLRELHAKHRAETRERRRNE